MSKGQKYSHAFFLNQQKMCQHIFEYNMEKNDEDQLESVHCQLRFD